MVWIPYIGRPNPPVAVFILLSETASTSRHSLHNSKKRALTLSLQPGVCSQLALDFKTVGRQRPQSRSPQSLSHQPQ